MSKMPSTNLLLSEVLAIILAVSPVLCFATDENVVNVTLYYEGLCSPPATFSYWTNYIPRTSSSTTT
ncbi:hypothetical protein MRX96_031801 [Rhipicephalus microplus]